MSSFVRSATSFRIIGRSRDSSPSSKNGRCKSMMACMVLSSVCWRCFTALMNPCAASTFCLRNIRASFDSLLWFCLLRVCSSSSSVNSRLSRSSGTFRLLRLRLIVPSSSVSTRKSGIICCRFFPMASPMELPGRGFSLVSSAAAELYCSSVIFSF